MIVFVVYMEKASKPPSTIATVQFTSLHNQPSLRQMLSVDLPIGYTKMRFSYLADLQQSNVNGIKTHTYSHVFMVGFVKDLYRVSNKKGANLPPSVRAY